MKKESSTDGVRDLECMLVQLCSQKDWSGIVDELMLIFIQEFNLNAKENKCRAAKYLERMEQNGSTLEFIECLVLSLVMWVNNKEQADATLYFVILSFLFSSETDLCKQSLIQFITILFGKFLPSESVTEKKSKEILSSLIDEDKAKLAFDFDDNMAAELWNNIREVRLNNSASFERKIENQGENVTDNNITGKESFVIKTGDIAAESIYKSANFIRKGLSSFVEPNVTRGIEAAGDFAINQITPIEICDGTRDTNHSSVGISQSSVKATGIICSGACAVSFGLRNALGVGIRKAAEKFNDNHVGKKIIPNDDLRDTFKGVGKVGVTALGASLIVAESMFETTKAGEMLINGPNLFVRIPTRCVLRSMLRILFDVSPLYQSPKQPLQ